MVSIRFLILFAIPLLNVDATYVSLKSSEINMRVGPGKEYPITWIIMKTGLPVMVVSEFDQWKKIRLHDGTEGWIHKTMISYKNNALVSKKTILYKNSSESNPKFKIENNVIVRCLEQKDQWVKVEVNKIKGWLIKKNLWGVNEL